MELNWNHTVHHRYHIVLTVSCLLHPTSLPKLTRQQLLKLHVSPQHTLKGSKTRRMPGKQEAFSSSSCSATQGSRQSSTIITTCPQSHRSKMRPGGNHSPPCFSPCSQNGLLTGWALHNQCFASTARYLTHFLAARANWPDLVLS